ncbi:unnamed protein product [Arctogadus glacialis]
MADPICSETTCKTESWRSSSSSEKMCGRQSVHDTETGPGAALIEDANERMRGKSAEPVEQCRPNGGRALCESIRVQRVCTGPSKQRAT